MGGALRAALAGALALAMAAPAAAQDQAQMNAAAAARLKAADAALNRAYARLLAEASSGGRQRLRTAQRAWLRFRDADCAARTGARGGSFYPAALADCLRTVTQARLTTLEAERACAEGDLGCGGHRSD